MRALKPGHGKIIALDIKIAGIPDVASCHDVCFVELPDVSYRCM